MPTEETTQQDWSWLKPGDRVTVTEYRQEPYRATVDLLTPNTAIIWVLPENGATRRAFDCREDVIIHTAEKIDLPADTREA